MIREISVRDIHDCANLIEQTNTGCNQIRYFPNYRKDIIERIEKRLNSEKHNQYVSDNDEVLNGYLELLIEEQEKYIQILAFFAINKYKQSLYFFLDYLKKQYPGFMIDFVVNESNVNIIEVMNKVAIQTDGLEIMMQIKVENFQKQSNSDNIIELSKNFESQFITYHNDRYQNVYWNGERLIKQKDKFKMLITLDENIINGYIILSNFDRDEEEIYFLYGESWEIKNFLIIEALNFSASNTDSVLVLLSGDEIKDQDHYIKLGFNIKEKVYTFHIK